MLLICKLGVGYTAKSVASLYASSETVDPPMKSVKTKLVRDCSRFYSESRHAWFTYSMLAVQVSAMRIKITR